MLKRRLIVGTAIALIASALCWADYTVGTLSAVAAPGVVLAPLWLVAIAVAGEELRRLFREAGADVSRLALPWGVLLIVASGMSAAWSWFELSPVHAPRATFLCFGVVAWAAGGEAVARFSEGRSLFSLSAGVFSLVYLGLCGASVVWLRAWHSNAVGITALVSLIAVVKLADAAAYGAGRLFGRAPMTPRLSPKKTWEGAVGALAGATAAAFIVLHLLAPQWFTELTPPSAVATFGYALVLAAAGMTGDLVASYLKRSAGAKDSSGLLPGLGGAIDVIDSLLFAAPAAYLYWSCGLLG